MESAEVKGAGKPLLWSGFWIPLLLLTTGLLVTGVAAHLEARRATDLAEARYYAQHQALVNHLLANAQDPTAGAGSTSVWLQALFEGTLPEYLGLRIDTLERHTKTPLLAIRANGVFDPTRSLRTEVAPLDQQWMLTTVPSPAFLEAAAGQSRRTVWLAGGTLSLFATVLALVLSRRLHQQTRYARELAQRGASADHQIANLQVEKTILRQALNDSEQRSRDLVALSGAVIWELDERAFIGFVSPQIADLLDRAPADLAGIPLADLVAPDSRVNFNRALAAARTDNTVERIDLALVHRDPEIQVPVVLRVRALKDTVHGLAGYRVSTLHHVASPSAGLR